MKEDYHKNLHIKLHSSLDELIGDMIMQTEMLPSKTTVAELMEWAYEQTKNPTKPK